MYSLYFDFINKNSNYKLPTYMQKHQQDIKQYSQHANNVLAWLQSINKTTKQSPRQHLQQQIQSLSLSYKNAQQKLLTLQKQVYYQSIYNEKQRSIIDILKYIINGNLDDDTILTYLVQMQDQSNMSMNGAGDDGKNKYQIKKQLEEIKQMVIKRKLDGKKVDSLRSGAISDLKKQLVKCNQVKKQLMEDLDRTLNQKGAIQQIAQQLKQKLKQSSQQNKQLTLQVQSLKQKQQKLTQQSSIKQTQLQKANTTISQNQQFIKKIKTQLNKIIKLSLSQDKQQQPKDVMKIIMKLEDKLQKYKNLCKQLSEKVKMQNRDSQLMGVMRMFLPDDAVRVYQEFQKNGQRCLLNQMEGIARLQHKKYSQLQKCQQQVWRLKQKLLRQGDGSWLKSRKTFTANDYNICDKQNENPNFKVSQFQAKSPKSAKTNQQ